MASTKAIERIPAAGRSRLTVAHLGLGVHGQRVGSPRQAVRDGDTVHARSPGNLTVRLLGVDTPEKRLPLPGDETFLPLSDPLWQVLLTDPFDPAGPVSAEPFSSGLREHLASRLGAGAARNHRRHANAAEDEFEQQIISDREALGHSDERFRFFVVFAFEVMDRHGRLLCYVNCDQRHAPRPDTYNERLLARGAAPPYFIWPNVNPWRARGSFIDAVIPPGMARTQAEGDWRLRKARRAVRSAREQQAGIWDAAQPLRLLPFELRYLSRAAPPDRWVIDLSKNDDVLIEPQDYYTVPAPEDRLFVPPEFVPLFVEAGWRRP